MNARTLHDRLQTPKWQNHFLILVCDSESDFECQAVAKFLEILKKGNPDLDLDVGFVDAEKNRIDSRLMDSPVSPRIFGFNKKRKFRAQLFAQEFSFDGLVNWGNETFFGNGENQIVFGEDLQKEVTLEIAGLKGERDQVEKLMEEGQNEDL